MSRPISLVSLVLAVAFGVGGCSQSGLDPTASLSLSASQADSEAGKGATTAAEQLGQRYQSNPKSSDAARAYALSLRQSGDKQQALEIADKALKANPKDVELKRLHAMLSLEQGKVAYAEKALAKVRASDWQTHSALGVAYASRGRQKEAQAEFAKALRLSPDQPSVLNNLALSYALEGKRDEAEAILRKLSKAKQADPRVHQNLALVVGVGGQIEESTRISRAVMPKATVRANAQYLSELTGGATNKRAESGQPAARTSIRMTHRVAPDPTAKQARTASAPISPPTYQLGGPRAEH